MQSFVINLSLVLVWFLPSLSHAEWIELTPKKVLELIESRSTTYQDSLIRLKQAEADFYKKNSMYKWSTSFSSGYAQSKIEPVGTTNFLQSDRYRTDVSLSRSFLSGTLLGLTYANTSLDTKYDSLSTPSNRYNQNLITLSIEQRLFPYFFGSDNRALYSATLNELKAQTLTALLSLKSLKVEALQLFWNAYIAQATLNEARLMVERYDELTKTVRRKNNFNYTGPGDLPQALIEYESRKQTLRDNEIAMISAMNALKNYLGLHESDSLRLIANNEAELPGEFKGDIKNLPLYRSQESRTQAAKEAAEASAQATAPNINLIAKYSKGGLESDFNESLREMSNERKDEAYVGFSLTYVFDNEAARKDSQLKSSTAQNEETKLARRMDELKAQIQEAYAKVYSGFENIRVSQNILSLREKVVTELTRTFNQGRTDISILIDAINKQSTARIQIEKALADFQLRRMEYLNLIENVEE